MKNRQKFSHSEYKYGFSSSIESEKIPKGLSEKTVKEISKLRNEPKFILNFRLEAYKKWLTMEEPRWVNATLDPIDFQDICYYSQPKSKAKLDHLEKVDPEILRTLEKLNIPVEEQKRIMNVSVDVVFDSVSIGTTFKEKLKSSGVILCSMKEAIEKYPDLIQKYMGSVIAADDNFYAALNSSVFSDGSFVYVPKGVTCPVEISSYFRILERDIGQFERTLIIADEGASVSYLEGCTAPAFDVHQLHAGVVELIALKDAQIKYSTVQNWYAGDPKTGKGGIYNFVTKRGLCEGERSQITWSQVEVGAAITWKYPGCILKGDYSSGKFYSVALTNGKMQADTGTKMIHIGNHTKSLILSKGISADESHNTYRGLVKIHPQCKGARNYSQCDSMLIGNKCSANTFPTIDASSSSAILEHEASTSKMNEDQLFYLQSRGISKEDAIHMIVNGFCRDIIKELPLEFAAESQKLLTLKLERSIG